MTQAWTRDRVLNLAPDASSASAAQGQAKRSKWVSVGRSDIAFWGEIQGSGKNPYQVRIDTREMGYKCSCPSRKFPCKHALGLLLLVADSPGEVSEAAPPDWVATWLDEREARSEKREEKAAEKAAKPVDAEAQAKRAAKREERVQAGIAELQVWLRDLVRSGLAAAQVQPGSYWQHTAARMVDAQAPGLATMVRKLADCVASGEGWQHRAASAIGKLHLLIEGFSRIDTLPNAVQADIRAAVGWTQSTDELLLCEGVKGRWLVLGQRAEEEAQLTVQRTWLLHEATQQPALVLHFAAGNQSIDTSLVPGTAFDGEVVYYPGHCPLRAIVKGRESTASLATFPAMTISAAIDSYTAAQALTPWVDRWPFALDNVTVVPRTERGDTTWWLRGADGVALPIAPSFNEGWSMLAITGGRAVRVCGEWDGQSLTPLALATDTAYFVMGRQQQQARWGRVAGATT